MQDDDEVTSPEAIGKAARRAIVDALGKLAEEGVPLSTLLAHQALKEPDKLLKAMGRYAPNRSRDDALLTVQAMHLAALRALAKQAEPRLITLDNDDWLS